MTHVVIVGGGHAAAQAVTSLRQCKFEGSVTLISDEPSLPYQRPPLSKAYLSGELTAERLPILRQQAYDNAGVMLKLGLRATRIDRAGKVIELGDGETVSYDKLILATGGHARRLTCPGHDLKGLHYVRTMADTDAMRAEFLAAKRLVIVGGGYIGLETAAVARKMGKEVTVLEAADRILQRVVAPEVSACYQAIHEAEGVQVLTNQSVTAIDGKDGRVAAVLTADGGRYDADVVVAGIGLVANADLAAAAGLEVHPMGIVVDDHCRTTDPDIYAVGDVTWHHNALYGRDMRIESVQNAVDQAKVAVENICGEDMVYDALPWFWSDQYGMKLQIAGLSQGYDTLVTRGDAAARSVAFFYLKDGVMIAADCVSRVAEFMGAKKLIAERVPVKADVLADDSRGFKDIVTGFLAG